jgi:sensor histidine kinase regulating citrate/malate metabolism
MHMPVKKAAAIQRYIYSVCFLVIAIIVFGIFIYSITGRLLKQQMGNKCLGLASAVAAFLEEYPKEYLEFIETLDTGSEYYIRTKNLIEKIRYDNADNIIYLYSEVRVSEDEMMFVFDGEMAGSVGFSPPGSRDLLTVTRRQAYDTQRAVKGDFATNAWGTLLTSYAPVFDAGESGRPGGGKLIGLVGADVSIAQYNEIMHRHFAVIMGSTLITALMGFFIIRLGMARIRADKENAG